MLNEHSVLLADMLPIIEEKLAAGQTVTFSPRGTSMLPMIIQGRDTVELSPIRGNLKKFDLPLYRRANGQFVLHRIVKVGDCFTCIGDNQFIFESGIEITQMIAVVSAFTHNGKKYSVTSGAYRFYCRFWHYSRPIRRAYKGILRRIFKKGQS